MKIFALAFLLSILFISETFGDDAPFYERYAGIGDKQYFAINCTIGSPNYSSLADFNKYVWQKTVLSGQRNLTIIPITKGILWKKCLRYTATLTYVPVSDQPMERNLAYILKIRDIYPDDAGNYTCLYKHENKSVEIAKYRIKVNRVNDKGVQLNSFESDLPYDVRYKGPEDRPNKSPDDFVKWQLRYHRRPPSEDKDSAWMSSYEYLKLNLTRYDSGEVYCSQQKYTRPQSYAKKYDLNVKFRPTIYVKSSRVQTKVGDRLFLEFMVEAFPRADIKWFRNGTEKLVQRVVIENSYDSYFTRVSIHLLKVLHDDFGDHICVAENEAGKAERTVIVEPNYSLLPVDPRSGQGS